MNKNRQCLLCDAPVIGRSDKKYCSDQCRALANHREHETGEIVVATNRILRKNRNILMQLCPKQKVIVERELLESLGFNFGHFTALLITARRDVYYINYDYAFTPLRRANIDKALIVKGPTSVRILNPWQYLKSSAAKSE